MNPEKRRQIFERLKEANPSPRTELVYHSPFQLLIAVMLSAQATDKSVNLATPALFKKAATPQAMLELGEAQVMDHIKTIGLFRTKAKNVIATSRLLVEKHGGHVPRSRDELQELPGVGRKTANVVLNVAYGEPTIAVDTHIFRVSNRTGLAPGKDPLQVELRLEKFVPQEYVQHAHHWLILHGRYTCIARKPDCPNCVIADLCEYKHKTKAEESDAKPRQMHPSSAAAPKTSKGASKAGAKGASKAGASKNAKPQTGKAAASNRKATAPNRKASTPNRKASS